MRLLVFGMFWFASLSVHAQIDSILALPGSLQIKALWDTYFPVWTRDSASQVAQFDQLQEELHLRGEVELFKQAWLIEVFYKTLARNRYSDRALTEIESNIAEAEHKEWDDIVAELLIFRGRMCYDQNRFGPAFESFLRGYDVLRRIGFAENPYRIRHVAEIAETYYQFGDIENAARFAREAISYDIPWDNVGFRRQLMNTLGLCYQKMERYDSAMYFFDNAYRSSLADKDSTWAALTYGNLGFVHFLKGEYDEAIPMLQFDFEVSHRMNEFGSAINAALALAEIYLLKGNAAEAQGYIEYARNVNRDDPRALSSYYKSLYAISKLRGDLQAAVAYADSFHIYRDKMLRQSDAKVLAQANLKLEVERHAHELSALQAKRDREILLRNGALLFLLMTGVISVMWLSRRSLKRKKEYELSQLQKKIAEDELLNAQRELHTFTKALKEKNELIESFKGEIETLHQEGMQHSDARTEHLSRLVNATLLTEDDWREFRQLFDKVYPGFFIRLKEKMPDLNPADIRLLALTKLQLAPKEMAAMLGIGYEAIKKSRQRLRKKINLPEEGTLDELVEMI